MSRDKIGVDQWVEQHEQRLMRPTGIKGWLDKTSKRLPVWAWLIILVVLGFLLPFLNSSDFVLRVAGNVALYGTLALGLNVVVGYAGLLDLGFIAFYGIGAYTYAYLSSDFTGVHLPTWLTLLIVLAVSGAFGLLLGSPSLRLVGDYLAIVTLGFGQIFVELAIGLTRVEIPGREQPLDLTGGPNGIPKLDHLSFFGFNASSVQDHYLILLVVLALAILLIYHLNKSRIGRAWRALREDELAAEAMGMPTRRLKLQAFAVGATLAGLSGALFAGWQGSVFPQNFDTALLITIYAVIVLGGLGSLPGLLLGALVIIAFPDVLRNATLAGQLFYLAVLLSLFAVIKPRWQIVVLIVALVLFGLILRPILISASPELFGTMKSTKSVVIDTIRNWLAIPKKPDNPGNLAFVAVIVLVLVISKVKQQVARLVLLVPMLYLLIFTWETRLSEEPSITRLIFVGVLLIVLMIYRPNGLLGTRRVEIV